MKTSRAEREGFEPSDPVSQVNSLAVSPIRPLSHLSTRAFAFHRGTIFHALSIIAARDPCWRAYANARRAFGSCDGVAAVGHVGGV